MQWGLIGAMRVPVCRLRLWEPTIPPPAAFPFALACGKHRTCKLLLWEWAGAQSLNLRRGRIELRGGKSCRRSWDPVGSEFSPSPHMWKPEGACVKEPVVTWLSLDRVFVSNLYSEGLASGWGLSLCKVKPSLPPSWLVSLPCQCTFPAIPPSPGSCPGHRNDPMSSFIAFADASKPQESLPCSDCLDMPSLKPIVWSFGIDTEMVKINFNLGKSHFFISNKIHLIEYN